jgi:hypothetical protein
MLIPVIFGKIGLLLSVEASKFPLFSSNTKSRNVWGLKLYDSLYFIDIFFHSHTYVRLNTEIIQGFT